MATLLEIWTEKRGPFVACLSTTGDRVAVLGTAGAGLFRVWHESGGYSTPGELTEAEALPPETIREDAWELTSNAPITLGKAKPGVSPKT